MERFSSLISKSFFARGQVRVRDQLYLWLMALVALYQCWTFPLFDFSPRLEMVTFLRVFPDTILYNPAIGFLLRLLSSISLILWCLNCGGALTAYLSSLTFFLFASLSAERSAYTSHQGNITCIALFLMSVWYQAHLREIRAAPCFLLVGRRFAFSAWVHNTLLITLCFGYTWSGLTKLSQGGVQWADGLALQLWTLNVLEPRGLLSELLLKSRSLAGVFQIVTLFAETFALLALSGRYLRFLIGFLLLGFHIGGEMVFGFGFYANIIAILFSFILNPLPVVLSFRKGLRRPGI